MKDVYTIYTELLCAFFVCLHTHIWPYIAASFKYTIHYGLRFGINGEEAVFIDPKHKSAFCYGNTEAVCF